MFLVFRDSYVLCIYVMNILCTFHILMYGYVTHTFINKFIHTHRHTFNHTFIHIFIRTYTFIHVHICIQTHIHAFIYAHMHTLNHTYIHTYKSIYCRPFPDNGVYVDQHTSTQYSCGFLRTVLPLLKITLLVS